MIREWMIGAGRNQAEMRTEQTGQDQDDDTGTTSEQMKRQELSYFVFARGMSIEEAARLVDCEPALPSLHAGRRITFLPTPDQIAAACERLRRWDG